MRAYYLVVLFCIVLSWSCSQASNCGDCEIKSGNMTNIGIMNDYSSMGKAMGPYATYENVNVSYCGCPEMVNTAIANSSDKFGRASGPIVVYEKVNLSYFSSLDITKIPHLVTNMTEVGTDLVLLEYNITVTNTGQVNITGIQLIDPRLGEYKLGMLMPGENVSITPNPYYIITPDDVKYCSINNIALVIGKDRCCKTVGPSLAYVNFPMAAKNLETYLKEYTYQLLTYGYDLHDDNDAESLADFEEKIRIQANRLMVLEDAMHGNVSCCQVPPAINFAVLESTDHAGGHTSPQVTYNTINPQISKCSSP